MTEPKINVNFFQRKPREGFDYSLEFIFNDVRKRLASRISYRLFISRCHNDGYFSKIINIVEAAFRQRSDVNHITGEIHFLNFLMLKKRVILTIHDCGMVGRKSGVTKKFIQWLYLAAPVKRAKIITANSEATKNEIVRYTGIDPTIIKVIPVAVGGQFIPSVKVFNRSKPIILQIGTGYNKNIFRIIEALQGINCHLTIVGKLSDEHLSALEKAKIDFSMEYNISNERIVEKYRECDIVSFISTFEGFGMPIVEANTVERVVITSNLSSMPEVAGGAAHLVNPYDAEDIRNGFLKIINDGDLREDLINKGRINKLRFDGDKIAGMYYDLYQEIKNT